MVRILVRSRSRYEVVLISPERWEAMRERPASDRFRGRLSDDLTDAEVREYVAKLNKEKMR